MNTMIRLEEVTYLAAFVEAGDQLTKCEFFGDDDQCAISETFAYFSPSSHLQAVLAPFRRMWMNNENANFNRVAKIIEHHTGSEERRGIARQQRELFNHNKAANTETVGLSVTDVIDLWIYTQFAHCQTNPSKGKFVRQDFDHWESKIGKLRLEYEFRNSVKFLGMHFLILYHEAALPEYKEWIECRGVNPPFKAKNAFGSNYTETDQDGATIHRGSNRFLEEELPAQRFARILERNHYRTIKFLLRNILGFTSFNENVELYTSAYRHVSSHISIWDLLATLGYPEGRDSEDSYYAQSNFYDSVSCRNGTINIYRNKQIEFKEAAKEIVERLYGDFRQELMNKTRASTFVDVNERLKKEITTRQNLRKRSQE